MPVWQSYITIDSSSLLEMSVSPCTEKSTEFIRSVFSLKVFAERKFFITCSVNFIASLRENWSNCLNFFGFFLIEARQLLIWILSNFSAAFIYLNAFIYKIIIFLLWMNWLEFRIQKTACVLFSLFIYKYIYSKIII